MRESKIETNLRNKVAKLGGLCFKFVSPGFTGVPDRQVLLPGGIFFYVELKAPGKSLSPRQRYVKRQLEILGFVVYVIDYMITDKQLQKLIDDL